MPVDSCKDLQILYFNMVAKLFENKSWDDTIIEQIIEQISKMYEMDYIAIYAHFEKSASLRLMAVQSNRNNYIPAEYVTGEHIQREDFFLTSERPENLRFLILDLKETESMLLVFSETAPITEERLLILKQETEKLFTVVGRARQNMLRDKNNKFLLDTSTKLIRTHDKGDVLLEIVESLRTAYKDYTFYLILTQEYNQNSYLPLKVMKYSDKQSMPVSTKVFMTGKLEIEVMKDKKVIYAPLLGEQSVYGVLELIAPIDEYFTNQELEFIEEFAILSGKALEKTILYEDSLAQVSNLTLLNEYIHELNGAKELEGLTELVRKQIILITKASEIGFIYFGEESDCEFEILAGSTDLFDGLQGREIADIYKKRIINNPDSIFSGDEQELNEYGYSSAMIIPMVYSGHSLGFTVILHEKPYHFTFENYKLTESLMQHSVLAISNTILREKLQQTVITDFLTQLYTRSYLEENITEHQEIGTTGALLLIDIDDFKAVNDTYGHPVGDQVLKQVATTMRKVIGEKGVVARWGGEELAVYLPEVNSEQGLEIANEVRASIPAGTDPSITVSCGISFWKEGVNDTQERLFQRADQALYQAKSHGKDCVLTL